MTTDNTEPDTMLPVHTPHGTSPPIPAWSGEKSRAAPTPSRSTPSLPPMKPERKSSEDDARHNHHNAVWAFSVPLSGGRAIRVVFPKSVVVRTAKSVILAAKVLSVPSACPSGGKLYALTTSSLVLLAISDTWFENWNVTFGLGVLHLAILRFGYRPCSNV